MKKFLSSIFCLFLCSIVFAQLNVIDYVGAEKYLGEINNIKRVSFKNGRVYIEPHADGDMSYIKKVGNIYYLCTRKSLESYNSRTYSYDTFLVGEERTFCLGKNKASSLKTLSDLLTICKTYEINSKLTVTDAVGTPKTIHIYDKSGPFVDLQTKGDNHNRYIFISEHGLYHTDDIKNAIKIVNDN